MGAENCHIFRTTETEPGTVPTGETPGFHLLARYGEMSATQAVPILKTIAAGAGAVELLLGDIANQVGITIEQFTHHEHVLQISRTDALTGLLNRGAFCRGLSATAEMRCCSMSISTTSKPSTICAATKPATTC